MDTIVKAICWHYKTGLDLLKSNTRKRPVMDVRLVCYQILNEKGYSWKDIGRYFNRDHSTVLHGARVARDLEKTNQLEMIHVRKLVDTIREIEPQSIDLTEYYFDISYS